VVSSVLFFFFFFCKTSFIHGLTKAQPKLN